MEWDEPQELLKLGQEPKAMKLEDEERPLSKKEKEAKARKELWRKKHSAKVMKKEVRQKANEESQQTRTAALMKEMEEYKKKPRVMYIGHLPFGFFETQLRRYFCQFGYITRLRVSRNRRSGHFRHFAFVEFDEPESARIATETMNGYILFGRRLVCTLVPNDDMHPDAFYQGEIKHADLRQSEVHLKRQRRYNELATDDHGWRKPMVEKLLAAERRRRKSIRDSGVDYDYPGFRALVKQDPRLSLQLQKPTHKDFATMAGATKGVGAKVAN
eukprot:TRINITY_DN18463_c0_g1_i1.p1 TRINITY_DN18463_c0_g1~~TRINITY_DN18463_c0_g1_i1.p1  ORF type:complete len:272 (+),score=66.45 TRINITY_DN18463_c0_g1_i1:102-917(+)